MTDRSNPIDCAALWAGKMAFRRGEPCEVPEGFRRLGRDGSWLEGYQIEALAAEHLARRSDPERKLIVAIQDAPSVETLRRAMVEWIEDHLAREHTKGEPT